MFHSSKCVTPDPVSDTLVTEPQHQEDSLVGPQSVAVELRVRDLGNFRTGHPNQDLLEY